MRFLGNSCWIRTLPGPEGAQTELGGEAKEVEDARLLSFIREHVVFVGGDENLELALEVRELYTKGGPVPGGAGWHTPAKPSAGGRRRPKRRF